MNNEKLEAGLASDLNRELDTTSDEWKLLKRLANSYDELVKNHGWQDAIYCPKDGSVFLAIEAGSTGIHECTYEGKWPDGKWWLHEEFNMYPSKPILWKPKP